MPICSLDAVHKTYLMGEVEVHALRGVSIGIEPGEFTVFAGPSGSGKSTLLNMVGLLDTPTRGSVIIDGQPAASRSERALGQLRAHRIGFIFQSFNLIPVLTAAENVALALRLAGDKSSASDRRDKVVSMLTDVGLAAYVDRRPSQLSGGQQQRVAIARALVKQPALVIADEPTANLDSKSAEEVLDVMCEMNETQGATFIFSSHDDKVIRRAKRIVHLRDGELDRIEERSA